MFQDQLTDYRETSFSPSARQAERLPVYDNIDQSLLWLRRVKRSLLLYWLNCKNWHMEKEEGRFCTTTQEADAIFVGINAVVGTTHLDEVQFQRVRLHQACLHCCLHRFCLRSRHTPRVNWFHGVNKYGSTHTFLVAVTWVALRISRCICMQPWIYLSGIARHSREC